MGLRQRIGLDNHDNDINDYDVNISNNNHVHHHVNDHYPGNNHDNHVNDHNHVNDYDNLFDHHNSGSLHDNNINVNYDDNMLWRPLSWVSTKNGR